MHRAAIRKQRERHLLSLFLDVASLPVKAVEDSESPDFILELDGRRVGIELTELYRPAVGSSVPSRAQENLTDRIVWAARRIYEAEAKSFVHVNVAFFEGINIRTLDRDATARSLCKLVLQMSLIPGVHTQWRNDYEDPDLDAIAFVTVISVPQASMAHWFVARAGWRASLSEELLAEAIAAKNHKLPIYRSKLDEVWLLLAVEGNQPSQFFDPNSLPDIGRLGSAFDRTYFFNSVHDQVRVWKLGDRSSGPSAA
jgi:hypothetical protein